MTKHMFRCFIGKGKMSQSELETRINDWVQSNGEWQDDSVAHTLTQTNADPIDGSGTDYWRIDVRFYQTDTKANLQQKFGDKLKNKVGWYRVGYHACDHDEVGVNASDCAWQDSEDWPDTASVPSDIPTF